MAALCEGAGAQLVGDELARRARLLPRLAQKALLPQPQQQLQAGQPAPHRQRGRDRAVLLSRGRRAGEVLRGVSRGRHGFFMEIQWKSNEIQLKNHAAWPFGVGFRDPEPDSASDSAASAPPLPATAPAAAASRLPSPVAQHPGVPMHPPIPRLFASISGAKPHLRKAPSASPQPSEAPDAPAPLASSPPACTPARPGSPAPPPP